MYCCTYVMLIIIHVSSTGLEDSHYTALLKNSNCHVFAMLKSPYS